jgi:hypothetical protein
MILPKSERFGARMYVFQKLTIEGTWRGTVLRKCALEGWEREMGDDFNLAKSRTLRGIVGDAILYHGLSL